MASVSISIHMDERVSVNPLLHLDSVSVTYGRGWVLRGITLDVHVGDVVGVVGESGCGKSTLGLAILGLLPSTAKIEGTVVFEGRDLAKLSAKDRRRMLGERLSAIPQASMNALDPVFPVGSQIVESLRAHRSVPRSASQDVAVRWLKAVGIPAPAVRAKNLPHELSGGMRQRATIAASLVLEPSLLIADEPTSALDVSIQAQILSLFRSLIDEKAGAVLLISHDLGVIAQLCNRVAVMYAGQIVEDATVHDLFESPMHPYTQRLLAAHPALTPPGQRLATIKGEVPDPSDLPQGCSFRPRCPFAVDGCTRPQDMRVPRPQHSVRCIRYDT